MCCNIKYNGAKKHSLFESTKFLSRNLQNSASDSWQNQFILIFFVLKCLCNRESWEQIRRKWKYLSEFLEAGFVGFAEFADGLVADLADTLALQIHVLGNLGHRLVLLVDAEEGVHYPTLALV